MLSSRACLKKLFITSVRTTVCFENVFHFYCATLCISAVFAVARCLSVRLSVTFVYCFQTAKDIAKLFSRHDSPMILVFMTQAPIPIPKGTPSACLGVKYTGFHDSAVDEAIDQWRKRLDACMCSCTRRSVRTACRVCHDCIKRV